jgi:hypothetical protein
MKTLAIQDEINFFAALESIDQTAALESFSIGGLANRIADLIPNLTHAAQQAFTKYTSDKYDLKPLNFNTLILKKATDGATYMSVSPFQVYVPKGFQGNMKDYATALGLSVDFVNGIVERMTAFNTLVSAVISDKATRQSVRNLAVATNEQQKQRVEIVEAIRGFKNAQSRRDRAKLGEVYRSLGEINDTVALTDEILRSCSEVQMNDIERLIKDAGELLETLSTAAQDGSLSGLTPEVLQSVSSSTLTIARDVELYSIMMFAASELKQAMQDTAKEFVKAVRY